MMSALEAILKQRGCLAVLACLKDGAPLAVAQLSKETGQPEAAVEGHLTLLARLLLVEPGDGLEDEAR